MSIKKLLETKNPPGLPSAPKGWEAGKEVTGNRATGTTQGLPEGASAEERVLLESAGFNPDEWVIVGEVTSKTWQAHTKGLQIGDDPLWLSSFKFNCVRKGTEGADIDELIELVNKAPKAPAAPKGNGEGTFVFAPADFQAGKLENPAESLVYRFTEAVQKGVDTYKELRKRGEVSFIHVPWMGDEIEGFVSQDGRNAWRTTLTLTEQLRLTRRLMLYTVEQFAPLTTRLTTCAVASNHGEAMRKPKTTYDDDFGIDAMVAVGDALAMNPRAYGHVETFVPPRDRKNVTLDVNGTVILHTHGDDFNRGKQWEWWNGQAFTQGSEAHQADVLLYGHHHSFQLAQRGTRMAVQCPTFELNSRWWENRMGDTGSPGILTFITENGKARGFTIV